MSVRARARRKASAEDKRWALIAVGVVIGAFVFGYGLTVLSFSRGAAIEVATVPDVRDLTLAEARREMERADLSIAVGDSFPNPQTPAGSILAQSPLPGQEVSPGSEVQVFLSTGAPRPAVPSVQGMPADLATRALQTAGFDVLVEEQQAFDAPGTALGTAPNAGVALPLPATVRLLVSTGPPRVAMPAVVGMLEPNARQVLQDAGLPPTEIIYENNPFGEPGGVVGQEPAAGDSVLPGDPIRLRVTNPSSGG